MKDYEGALGYYQQALRVQEKVMGKTHPNTLMTIMGIAGAYLDGLKDFTKAEMIYRLALDGFERSKGKDHRDTKTCAMNMAKLFVMDHPDKRKAKEIIKAYPFLPNDPMAGPYIALLLGDRSESEDE